MSEDNNSKRTLVQARVNSKELAAIQTKYKKTTCRTLSEYVRKVLLEKPVSVRHRNQSLDDLMGEMMRLRSELNAIAQNYNQVVKKLHTLQQLAEVKNWLLLHDETHRLMAGKISEIKSAIAKINDQWLQ